MDTPFCVNCTHYTQENGRHLCLRRRYQTTSLITGELVNIGDRLYCDSEREAEYNAGTCKPSGIFFTAKD